MATAGYTAGLKELADGTIHWASDTIKLMLIANDVAYTYNADHTYVDMAGANDPIDCELNVSGYAPGFGGAGRATLASKTITIDTANDRYIYDAADPSAWTLVSGETVIAAIIYRHNTSDADSRLLFYVDFDDKATPDGTLTLNFNALGIFAHSMAAPA